MAFHTGTPAPRPPLLQRITPHQWAVIDLGLSVLFFLGGLIPLLIGVHGKGAPPNTALAAVAASLATLPIAVRRKYPVPVLIIVTSALAVSTLLGVDWGGSPAIALPLYIVATNYERRTSLIALCLVELALVASLGVAALLRPAGGDTFNIVLVGATWFVGDSIRARRAYVAGLTSQAEQQQRREVERAQQSIAEERLQIARELHDIVAHSLSVIAIQSGVGRHVLDMQPEEARKALAAVELTSRSALEELRRVLGVLRRDTPDGPDLTPASGLGDLDRLLAQVRAAGVTVDLHQHGEAIALPPSMDLSVYRIVQEALTNVTKHAGTSKAAVDIAFDEGSLVVTVTDDGSARLNGGRQTSDLGEPAGAHHGIIGMRERTAVFGGSLTAAPRQAGGFEVRACFPLAPSSP